MPYPETAWCLKSLGLPVDIGALQDEMVPLICDAGPGPLQIGRGYGLAEVLTAHLPSGWADRVHVAKRTDWAQLASRAGSGPIALGLHGAYHWIAVATVLPDGTLQRPQPRARSILRARPSATC